MSIQFGKINNNIFVNSTATYENGIVSISSPENAEKINFYAPSNANSSDLYEINGRQVILSSILNNNPEITWVKDAPISAVYDSESNKLFINSINGENSLFSNLFRNANAEVVENKVVINSVKEAVDLFNFYSIKEYSASDIYEVNGQVYEVVDLQENKLESGWISNVPVSLVLNDNKLWYSSGGGGKIPEDLPPLCPNFAINFSGTTVTVTANKLPNNDKTSMLAGGVWVLDSNVPDSPKGEIVKQWTKSQLIDSTQDVESDETVTWTYTNWTKGEPVYCRQYTYNEKGQYNTTVMGGVASTLDKPPYSAILSENTWEQIAQACADSDPILDKWQVGDTKDEVINGETLTFAIMGKYIDDKADGSGKAPLTFGMTQLMAATRQMNNEMTTNGSFVGSVLYAFLRDSVYAGMPSTLKNAIKPVNKKTARSGGTGQSIRTDAMSIWLFAEYEIFGKTEYAYGGEGTHYPYFSTSEKRIKKFSNGSGVAGPWWERSPCHDYSNYFAHVDQFGGANRDRPDRSKGVCFGFCI